MPDAVHQERAGTYVIGVFQGVTEEEYPKLRVATTPRADGTAYEERLQFDRFDRTTGARTLPDDLQPGLRVAVRVFVEAVPFVRNGQSRPFVSKRALQVEVL